MTNSRDIGLTGAGKGDKPRTKFDEDFRRKYDLIFSRWPGFISDDGSYKKVAPGRYRRVFK